MENVELKNRKWLWLWILGWIFIFPVPLTIVLVRNKKFPKIIKVIILIIAYLFYLLLLSCVCATSIDTIPQDSNVIEEQSINRTIVEESVVNESTIDKSIKKEEIKQESDSIETSIIEPKEDGTNKYSEDDIIDQFITDYNEISQYQMTDIEKGNIRTKYFGHTNECSIEMINATGELAEAFCVTINGGNNKEITEKMFEVFPEFIHTLDSSVTDEQIQQAIADFKDRNVLSEGYKLSDSITITYVPLLFREDGSLLSSSRIDIDSSTYRK